MTEWKVLFNRARSKLAASAVVAPITALPETSQMLFPLQPKLSGFEETDAGRLNGVCNVCGASVDFVDFTEGA